MPDRGRGVAEVEVWVHTSTRLGYTSTRLGLWTPPSKPGGYPWLVVWIIYWAESRQSRDEVQYLTEQSRTEDRRSEVRRLVSWREGLF